MNKDFEVRSFIVCDEVRDEVNRKQIIIGAYAGAILLPQIPFWGNIITIRIEFVPKKKEYTNVVCKIIKPNKQELGTYNTSHVVRYIEFPSAIAAPFTMPVWDQIGDHEVHLAMDGPFHLLGTFMITTTAHLPKTS